MIIDPALYDSTGTLFATYDYDAWGKLLSIRDASGNLITDSESKRSKANILVYLHSKGAHYFAFKWKGSEFVGYNVSNCDKSSKPLGKSIKAFIRNGNYWQREYMLISIS